MAQRASPPRKVAAWTKAAVAANETVPSAAADFVNLEASHVTHDGGFASGVYAILPDKHDYDRLRILFGPPTLAGTVTTASAVLYARLSDGTVLMLGSSDLTAAGTLASIEVENYQALYSVVVRGLTGGGATVSFDVAVQGIHQGYIN